LVLGLDYWTRQNYLAFKKHRPEEKGTTHVETIVPKPTHRRPHPVYHHGFVPNSSGVDHFGPTRTDYFINSAGFRDGRIRSVDLASPQPRVLLLGDSFAEGVGVPWGQTVAGRLAENLAPKGIEVLNGAVASYCPSLTLARLNGLYEKENLRLDLAVVFLDISDVEDELNYETRPEGGFSSRENSRFADPRFWTWDKKLCDWLEGGVEKNFTLLGAFSRNLRQAWRQAGSPGGTPELKRATWPEYHGPGNRVVSEGLGKAQSSMDGVLALLRMHRTELLVVIYPWLEQVDSRRDPSRVEVFWEEWAQRHQVPLLNLFPEFVPMGKFYEKKFCLAGDGHWNAAGHARVAAELLPRIEQILSGKDTAN